MIDHISFSQLDMLLRCGEQYRRRYINQEILPPSGSLVRGKCGHKALEHNFSQKIMSRQDLKKEEVIQVFSDRWEEEKFNIAFTPDELDGESPSKALGRFKDSGISLIDVYHTEQAPLIMPWALEYEFRIEFQGGYPALEGRIDRITQEGAVEDDKFVGRTPPENDADNDVQLTCYNLAYKIRRGYAPSLLRKRFAVDTKTPKTVVREAPPRSEDQLSRFLLRLERAMDAIQKGSFLPAANGAWVCTPRFCGYYTTCKVRP